MKTEKYRLFVAKTTDETIRAALDQAYSKASGTHVLIYTNGKRPPGFKEIRDEDAVRLLPSADKDWLKNVNLEIIKRFAEKHEKEIEEAGMKFLGELEEELKKERAKLIEEGSA